MIFYERLCYHHFMKKLSVILFLSLLFSNTLFGKTYNKTTLILASMSTLDNAQAFIQKHIPNPTRDIFIFKSGKYYIVTYGVYASRKEARISVDELPMNLQQLQSFTKVVEFDLKTQKDKIDTLVYFETVTSTDMTIKHQNIKKIFNLKSTPLKKN